MNKYQSIPYSHNGLKVFESVARLMSFTHAAEELYVTQSAVSRQVKQLEADLDTILFIRKNRAIELTEKGKSLHKVLSDNYQALEHLLSSWKKEEQKKIVIKAALSFATRSLIPKIQQLNDKYPDHELVVIPCMEEDNGLDSSDYDLLIFNSQRGQAYKTSSDVLYLREEYMAPVCAERLSRGQSGMAAIMQLPRLHPTMDHADWKSWLASTHMTQTSQVRNSTFLTLDMALSACLSGQGVTVTDLLLVLPELKHGYLVCPSGVSVQYSPWQYFCHYRTKSKVVDELIAWLQEQTKKDLNELRHLASTYGWTGVIE